MKALTKDEIHSWVASQPNLMVEEKGLHFRSSGVQELHFHYPTGEGQLIYSSRLLATLHHEESTFAGALLWITTWGVWSEWVEDIGLKTVAMLRGETTTLAALWETPGQLFGEDELLPAAAFLVQPILVGWDAYYYPLFKDQPTDFIIKISHDAYVDVMPATLEARKRIEECFSETAFKEAGCRRS
jgi:hypothetical protein